MCLTHRLKSFYEEGEREMMNEQILVLQNKVKKSMNFWTSNLIGFFFSTLINFNS